MNEHNYILAATGDPFSGQDLVQALDSFAAEGAYSSKRDQVLREIKGRPFSVQLKYKSAERTYGYITDKRLGDGKTITGTVEDSSHLLAVQMPAIAIDRIAKLSPGAALSVTILVTKWNSVSSAFESQFAFDLPDCSDDTASDPVEVQQSSQKDGPRKRQAEATADVDSAVDMPSESSYPATEGEAEEDAEPPGSTSSTPAVPAAPPPPQAAKDDGDELPLNPPADKAPDDDLTSTESVDELQPNSELPSSQEPVASAEGENPQAVELLHEITHGSTPLASWFLAEYIAATTGISPEIVDGAIQTFWSHQFHPSRFLEGDMRITVPFIGSFTLHHGQGRKIGVSMVTPDATSLAQAKTDIEQLKEDSWIEPYERDGDLPDDERRDVAETAVVIAEKHELDLESSYKIVLEFLSIVTTLLSIGSRRIRWPGFGEMYPARNDQGDDTYRFRIHKNLLRNLASIPFKGRSEEKVTPRQAIRRRTRSKSPDTDPATTPLKGCLQLLGIMIILLLLSRGCGSIYGAILDSPVSVITSPDERIGTEDVDIHEHGGIQVGFKSKDIGKSGGGLEIRSPLECRLASITALAGRLVADRNCNIPQLNHRPGHSFRPAVDGTLAAQVVRRD
jgi:hypothetical protein